MNGATIMNTSHESGHYVNTVQEHATAVYGVLLVIN